MKVLLMSERMSCPTFILYQFQLIAARWCFAIFSYLGFTLFLSQIVGAQDIRAIIQDSNPVEIIDSLDRVSRQELLSGMPSYLRSDPVGAGEILCRISPWTTGSTAQDLEIQSLAWELMREQENAETEAFRWLDCSAVNRVGFYRSAVLDPMFDLRTAYCSGPSEVTTEPEYLVQLIRQIEEFDQTVHEGLGGENAERFSYFPVRNSLRIANLTAARAIQAWEFDQRESRAILAEAAISLRERADAIEITETRNGWRWYYELRFHSALYWWLSGEGDTAELEAFAEMRPVLDDPVFQNAGRMGILDVIPEYDQGYIDPIFVERLLPGAQLDNPDKECGQWHRRSFQPRALVDAVLECASHQNDLIAFDTCMLGFEAQDWMINYQTATAGASEAAIEDLAATIMGIVNRSINFLEREADALLVASNEEDRNGDAGTPALLALDFESLRERLSVQTGEDPATGRVVLFAAPNQNGDRQIFTTTERLLLADAFARARPQMQVRLTPQFLRPRTY